MEAKLVPVVICCFSVAFLVSVGGQHISGETTLKPNVTRILLPSARLARLSISIVNGWFILEQKTFRVTF